MQAKEHDGKALKYLTIEPDGYQPDGRYPLVVLMHGYGSHMGDLAGLCPSIDSNRYVYALPNAPLPMQLGYGAVGYAWTAAVEGGGDDTGRSAEAKLKVFFGEVMELYGIEPGEVVLGGFSQGGMMAYRCGLPDPGVFRGLVALSAKLPEPDDTLSRLPDARSQAIFISHGTLDTMIPVADGRRSLELLEAEGYAPEYHEYEMRHEITEAVVSDLAGWLRGVLTPGAGSDEGR